VIFYYGTIDLTSGWTMRAGISGATLGLILAIVSWLGAPFAARLVPSFGTELEQLYGTLHRAPGPLKALPILVATVTAEELVWRGELIAWLQQRVTTVQTIAIATLSYATPVTMSRSPLLIVVAVCLGLALALQRIMLRSWQGPLIAHLVWALLVFVVKPLG
jgi:membrane protease YdiL (CAAX protease family)